MEPAWLQYHDEEAEVAIEIADVIFEQLASETAHHMQQLISQRENDDYFLSDPPSSP